jgi:hypothetical protein
MISMTALSCIYIAVAGLTCCISALGLVDSQRELKPYGFWVLMSIIWMLMVLVFAFMGGIR